MQRGMSGWIPLVAVGALFFYLKKKGDSEKDAAKARAVAEIKKSGKDPFEGAFTRK